MKFNENLKEIRSRKEIKQRDLALKMGVTPATIGNWERGVREPSLDLIIKLASTLETSTDELLGIPVQYSGTAVDRMLETIEKQYKALDAHGKKVVETVCSMEYKRVQAANVVKTPIRVRNSSAQKKRYIPFYDSPPAAGYSAPLEGESFEMIVADSCVPDNADYAVCISGDSMEPYIQDGQMVFVEEDAVLKDGDVGIFSVNGEMYCKQYYLDEQGNLHLLSANPDRADASVHVSCDSGYTVQCCGKVILEFNVPIPDYFTEH